MPRIRRITRISCCMALLAASSLVGCSAREYRLQADDVVYDLVDESGAAGCVVTDQFTIEVDPRSRMFDPTDPDCPPMPTDDAASHQFMQCVDCKKGSPCWRHTQRTQFVANPDWKAHLPVNEEGQVPLDLAGSVELALIHSPGYQSELEELYLSALDVSFERFRFDAQFFGGSDVSLATNGPDVSGTGSATSIFTVNPLSPGNRLRVQRLTATGGEILAGVANSLVWQFSGPNNYFGSTLIDFSIVQPLLRAGGRTRVLETLTIAERQLLANLRQLERFRRGFYTEIVTGRNAGPGPTRRGGFFGGSGLQGFSGVGGGGFGRIGGGGFGTSGGAGASSAGGFLGLLQTQQELRNQRANVAALRDSVLQLEATYEAGRIDRFQVDLTRQALFNAQSQLLNSEAGFASSIDSFKIDLGLPPDLPVRLEDDSLDFLQLLDPNLTAFQEEVAEVLDAARAATIGDAPPAARITELRENAEESFKRVRNRTLTHLADALDQFQQLEAALPQRIAVLERLAQREEVTSGYVDRDPFDPDRLQERVVRLRADLLQLDRRIVASCDTLQQLASDQQQTREWDRRVVAALTKLSGELLELSLARARARLDSIVLKPTELEPAEALSIASQHRRDWQNSRASLVDSWRLIFFNANDLLSSLDLTFSGDVGNTGENPLDINDSTGRLRVGLEFDAPITRVAERNVYRQALIEFQQARRGYYQFVDGIHLGLRNTLRTMRLNELNFELRREAVLIAIAQVDLTQLRLQEPPKPGAEAQFGDTTARDLVQALADLLNVQNDFLSVWVNYEVQRINLDFDLGTMELDHRGLRQESGVPLRAFLNQIPTRKHSPCIAYDDVARGGATLGSADRGANLDTPEEAIPPSDEVPAGEVPSSEEEIPSPEGPMLPEPRSLPVLGPVPPLPSQ